VEERTNSNAGLPMVGEARTPAGRPAGVRPAAEGIAGALVLLQYGDSAYPAGGFAQSWGLETAVAEGFVTDAHTLAGACRALLVHQVAGADAVAAAACCTAAVREDRDFVHAIDRRLNAARVASESRDASMRMGRRLLETAARAEPDAWLDALREDVRGGRTSGNHACVLGAVAGRAGLPPVHAATLALWTAASGLLNAALRLLRVTHDDVQAILTDQRPLMARLADKAVRTDPHTIAGGAPQFEIWSMRHETATVRLFAS
jgi:urease accessory protein